MTNVFDILEERGYIEQMTHPAEIKELFGKESVPFYIGIDPTADSLHVGHFVSLVIIFLISVFPDGSPIVAVPPPTNMIGLCPHFCI